MPGYEYTTWYGIFVPGKTPCTLFARLNMEIVKAMETPYIKDCFTALAATLSGHAGRTARLYGNESAKWAKIIKAANIRIE